MRFRCLLLGCWLAATVPMPAISQAATSAEALPIADRVVVAKSERRLYLMRGGVPFRSFRVWLGLVPQGRKEQEGDFRTPEGSYRLDAKNAQSDYFLSIHVSYPNSSDLAQARRAHVAPGGAIMIHGLPNLPKHPSDYYFRNDWTNGCIALTNDDMLEVWLLTRVDTPIEIKP